MQNPNSPDVPGPSRLSAKAKRWAVSIFSGRLFPLWVALLAAVLTLSSLKAGFFADDYHHRVMLMESETPNGVSRSPMDIFTFIDGDPGHAAEMMDYGILPWWTWKESKVAFFRPLASLTHWIDYSFWPDSPVPMHLESVLWYAGLVASVALLYRRFFTVAWVAGLAALLYAVDDAHGPTVAWLANRNALMAALFGVLALLVHDQWRRGRLRAGMVAGPALLVTSLLCAEAGIATCAYLFAYAVFMDRGILTKRLVSLAPYVVVVVAWRAVYVYLGYGENIGVYVDPLTEPLNYMAGVMKRAPVLLLGQWATPPSDVVVGLLPVQARLLWLGALIFLGIVAAVLIPLLRHHRSSRFWATGMILSVLPVCSTFPSDRLLLFVGIGAMALIAQMIHCVFGNTEGRRHPLFWRIPAVVLACLFILVHLVIAPLALPVRAASPMMPREFARIVLMTEALDESVKTQDMVLVNPPMAFLVTHSPAIWMCKNQPIPRRMRILTSSLFRPVTIHRADKRTLIVRPTYGFHVHVFDLLFRDKQHPFSVGDRVDLTGMTVEIREVNADGQATEAAFIFSTPLEDASLRWMQHKDGAFLPFAPPAVGETVVLPGFMPSMHETSSRG